ncbi:MAG: PLP-dependent aminotransferase family protein [Firmicutes bacterium]|nr:PLP-dependent aminotransferase family protein [Bacillota bacterium]
MEFEKYMTRRAKPLKASGIREMFKLMADPQVISLAGGSPDPELFPSEFLAEISAEILRTNGKKALAYGTTDGYAPLKDALKKRTEQISSFSDEDKIIITTGAQQAIDLAARVLVEDDEYVVVEAPSFVGTLNALRSVRARLIGVDMEKDGMDMAELENVLKSNKVKLIYTIPNFQNPTGITMSLEKREKMLALAKKYDCLILEDNPYGDLRFAGDSVPTIKSLDSEGRVIYVGSLSKILSPGLRIGYLVCRGELCDKIEIVKQVNDVHTPCLTQMMATEFLNRYDVDKHIKKACEVYGRKCRFMLSCMEKYFPKSVTWTKPEGGLFILVYCPESIDAAKLSMEAVQKYKVAFVPCNNFATDIDAKTSSFRLNYSTMPEEKIEEGIKAVGTLLKEKIGE